MIVQLNVPDYEGKGLHLEWEENSIISVTINNENSVVAIGGNREGLLSMARHLLTLAQTNVPSGYHIHFDDQNSLAEGSSEIIIGKL